MIMSTFDRLPVGTMDDFHHYREEKFNHLYFCRNCARSFDTVAEVANCKFCDSEELQIIASKKSPAAQKAHYRYFCPVCEKTFVAAHHKIKNCEFCGSRHIHLYKWERNRRDEFRTRLWRFFDRIMKRAQGIEEIDEANIANSAIEKHETKKEAKSGLKLPEKIKLPEFNFNFRSRNEEEMPTR